MENPATAGTEKIHRAAALIQMGRLDEAHQLLRDILARDEENIAAWELLSRATVNKGELTYILKHILEIRPDHPWAVKELDELEHPTPVGESSQPEAQVLQPVVFPSSPPVIQSPAIQSTAPDFATPEPAPPEPALPEPASPQTPSLQATQPVKKPVQKRRRKTPLVIFISGAMGVLCVALWGYYLMVLMGNYRLNVAGQMTQTAYALQQANCQVLIDQAMQAAGSSCDAIRGNSVCYGNFTIQSKLVSGSTDTFSTRGDIINIQDLQQLSASPLNLSNHQWGIAIFKVMANLPRSLPGENVTLMVFGNTTLDNQSPTLETFYFSSELGQVTCDKVPFDGITIDVPEGTGESFQINGTQLTLMGNASLKANQGGSMDVSLYSGSGKIVSNGQEQYFGAGQQVSVDLGGDNGMQAISVPSAPVPLSQADMQIACTMYGKFCNNAEITPVSAGQAQANIQDAFAPTATASPTPTRTATIAISDTPTTTPIPSMTGTPEPTPTGSRTPTRTATRTRTPTTAGGTILPTLTFSSTPTASNTPTVSDTPTNTATSAPTDTPSDTPTATDTGTATNTATTVPTSTPVLVVNIVEPPVGAHPLIGETNFEAQAWDPGYGSGPGDGIHYIDFWFTDSHGTSVPVLPDVGSPHSEYIHPYCAFGGGGSCPTMSTGAYNYLVAHPDTYYMYVKAYATHGGFSTVSISFIIP